MRKLILGFIVIVMGLLGSSAQASEYFARIDSVTPIQFSGACPATLQLKASILVPNGKTVLGEIKLEQTIPAGVTLPPLYGANRIISFTGNGSIKTIDMALEVYGAKAIWIEVNYKNAYGQTALLKSNKVSLSYTCSGAMASKLKKEINVQAMQQPPAKPLGLTATASKKIGIDQVTSVSLAWQAPAPLIPVDGYKIERKIQGQSGGFSLIAQVQKPQNAQVPTSYDDTGLDYGKTFIYRMKAFNQYGESPYSSQVNIHTQAADIAGQVANQKPAQPTGLSGRAVSSSKVVLHWQVASGNPMATSVIKGFAIFIRRPGDMWLPAGTMPVVNNQTTGSFTYNHESTGLKAGQQYLFRVCSYKDEALQQVSDYSNELAVTMPGAASGPGNKTIQTPLMKKKP